jgi:distribution and morphology protein 34
MNLRLSNFKLNAYVVLVVSKTKGITLVFKTDPLQNVDVSSTFDSIAVIQKYIQKEIEGQLREMFREDLPVIIHRLSQRWIPGNSKIETPYAGNEQRLSSKDNRRLETMSAPGHGSHRLRIPAYRFPTVGIRPGLVPRSSSVAGVGYARARRPSPSLSSAPLSSSSRVMSNARAVAKTSPSPVVHEDNESTFPELENYDPTYGMRPEGLPTKSVYADFSRLWASSRGLADLAEESADGLLEDEIDFSEQSFGAMEWNLPHHDRSVVDSALDEGVGTEYESIPAIGGGTITRPRVFHSQSITQTPTARFTATLSSPSLGFGASRSTLPSRTASGYFATSHSPLRHQWLRDADVDQLALGASAQTYHPTKANSSASGPSRPRLRHALPPGSSIHSSHTYDFSPIDISPQFASLGVAAHHPSPESSFRSYSSSGAITHSLSTPPSSEPHPLEPEIDDDTLTGGPPDPFQRRRKGSISLSAVHPFDDDVLLDPTASISHELEASPSATYRLRPSQNNAAHLSTLSHSNRTLCLFTRSLEHFTVRSGLHAHHRLTGAGGQASPATIAEPRPPVKAKRKRTFYVGGRKHVPPIGLPRVVDSSDISPPLSPSIPSESEVDHYFAAATASGIRRRTSSFHV